MVAAVAPGALLCGCQLAMSSDKDMLCILTPSFSRLELVQSKALIHSKAWRLLRWQI